MPKILITGNGFDLGFNLPTSYDDFISILSYLEAHQTFNFHEIYSNCRNFEDLENSYSDSIEFSIEEITILKEKLADNLWFQFFKNEKKIDSWIDFENRIEYLLKLLISSISKLKESIFSQSPIDKSLKIYDSKTLNNNVVALNVLDFFGIISLRSRDNYGWHLKKEFLVERYDFYIDINTDKIIEFLVSQLDDFKLIFNSYFSLFVLPLYGKSKLNIESNFFNLIHYHFTFNYTPTFEKFYSTNVKTNYLHGKINSNVNNIVLGIDDLPEKVENRDLFFPFTKYFQKLNCDTDFHFLNEIKDIETSTTLTNYVFFFWGHSLDQSDKEYINEVFDIVRDYKGRKNKIVIVYHSKSSKARLLQNLLKIRGKVDILKKMRQKKLIFCHLDSQELKTEINRDIVERITI
ncbi:hypothetical protein H0S70_11115 [Chryseobacterium manosquense]|uniref:Bacteriophage abortive infection AbiH family protein n=1 Tax=Chryseobacterium manosquense TaxID=2754694 RepID=A0A7H1DV92_9FLAO|nr:AbiH family protein [Chryseobacterium manosquense]QNS40900.1 hypothetical protein H0S70_11115 [Chryseobacterium manosquense]